MKRMMHILLDNAVYRRVGLAITTALCTASLAGAAIVYTEDFEANNGGWVDRDAGEMTVSYPGAGNPGSALQGTFGLQGVFSPETDAFRAAGAGNTANFMGDYTGIPITSWVFDFYAEDILPNDLIVRFSDGVSTWFRSVLGQVGGFGGNNWYNISVDLTNPGSWSGGGANSFNTTLGNVTFIDIQISRSGLGAQDYFVDNFGTLSGGGGGGGSAVPEPEEGLLFLGAMLLFAVRRVRFLPARA